MIRIGYYGADEEIEVFYTNLDSASQGKMYPGLYFSDSYDSAKAYADSLSIINKSRPRVYIAECNLESPLDVTKPVRLFDSFSEVGSFAKKYFKYLSDSSSEYLRNHLDTLSGNLELIADAERDSGLPLIEICSDIGFDSLEADSGFVITSPQQILSYMEVDGPISEEDLEKDRLTATEELKNRTDGVAFETTANQYVQSARKGRPYKTKPGNRFLRRVYIKMSGGNNIWFDIDMNRLFKQGSFAIKIPVVGETAEYISTVSFNEWLPKLKEDIAKTGFTQLTVKRSLMEMLRFSDLKVRCNCPDFEKRFAYPLSVSGDIEGDPETRPTDKTNPRNDLGKVCKHLAFCINNKIWGDKESRIIYNYFVNLKRTRRLLFDKMIALKLGLETQQEEEARLRAEREETKNPQSDIIDKELEQQVKEETPVGREGGGQQ